MWLFACNTKKADKEVSTLDTTTVVNKQDSAVNTITDSHYFWSTDIDPKKGLVMIKTRPIAADSLTAPSIIQLMNDLYPDIHLVFKKTSNDSIFISIPKSTYLTEQTGSSGADAYLAELTYNLTEIKGINFIDVRFKKGDHAEPGTYSRTDFVHAKD
jgi:hypothetical protein